MNIGASETINQHINSATKNPTIEGAGSVSSMHQAEEFSKPINMDTYTPAQNSIAEESATYRLGVDEAGNPKLLFNQPQEKTAQALAVKTPNTAEETTTINTDKVDKEIESLKEKKQAIEDVLKNASDAERKALEAKLSAIAAELVAKDNDEYRKANAIYS